MDTKVGCIKATILEVWLILCISLFLLQALTMSSKGRKGKGGGDWTGEVYFDYNADETGDGYYYTDPELKTELAARIGKNEVIIGVSYFKHPLSAAQVTAGLFHHAFVVFETEEWWWSIEKNEEGITIQRAKQLTNVRDYYRQERRTSHWHTF